jgi:hypothetical protein
MKKTILSTVLLSLAFSSSLFAAPSSTVTLTSAQKASILYMYQEEKVARDVYITLGKKYPTQTTFANIALSEQTHIDSVQTLCEKYGVYIANINESQVGTFVLPELQHLYDTLVVQGSVSALEGLKIGVAIEEKDIKDILLAEVGMPSDVVKKFESLRAGSISHLDAFNKAVAATK